MGIVQALKRAEEQARKAAQTGLQQTAVGLDDAARAIRRRMRIYPSQGKVLRAKAAAASTAGTPTQSQPAPGQDLVNVPKAS